MSTAELAASEEQQFDAASKQEEMARTLEAAADRISSPKVQSEDFLVRRMAEEARNRAATELRQKAEVARQPQPELSWEDKYKAS